MYDRRYHDSLYDRQREHLIRLEQEEEDNNYYEEQKKKKSGDPKMGRLAFMCPDIGF